jgi:hypothetical protein
VRPGGPIEIEAFLSGFGIPPQNKLFIQWSSPYIVDKNNPGSYTVNIATATDKVTGKVQLGGTGKHFLHTEKVDAYGITIHFTQGYFFANPKVTHTAPSLALQQGVSEVEWDSEPPLLLKINTNQHAPSGDYDITFAFTYGDAQHLLQDFKTASFHITSWWERNQVWIETVVGVIALVSLVITAVK